MKILAFIFSALSFSAVIPAQAQDYTPYQITTDGTVFDITLNSTYSQFKRYHLYFISTGNISAAGEVYAKGPAGVKISVETALLGNKDATEMISGSAALRRKAKFRLAGQKKELDSLTALENGVNGYFQIQKDACSKDKKARYLVDVIVDVSAVDPALFNTGFVVNVGAAEYPFKGDKASSIKPSSDGKYKGEPILLMSSIDHYGSEYVNVVNWRGGKVASQKRIPVVKYVQYKDKSLSLARLNGHLNGGQVTFELTDGGWVYGVCFKAVRSRQSANGYPAP